MRLRSFFILMRGRLITAAIAAMALAFLVTSNAITDNLIDIRAYWNHFCGCPPDPGDVRAFLDSFNFIALTMGYILGITTGLRLGVQPTAAAQTSSPVAIGDTPFQLTRPIPRAQLIFPPLLITTAAITIIPAICFALPLAWLKLVHAPAFAHIVADAQLIPAVAALGPHPTLLGILSAADITRHYLAAISLGLCAYSVLSCQRWLALSTNLYLRRASFFVALIPFAVPVIFTTHNKILPTLLLLPSHSTPLTYLPSTINISLHFAFAAAVILYCRRLINLADV